ncbi:MAG: acetate/propionate family kinase [Gemmatimonadota bacterium]
MASILTVNVGSSSIKFGLFEAQPRPDGDLPASLRGEIGNLGGAPQVSVVDADGQPVQPGPASGSSLGHPLEALMPWLEERIGTEQLLAVGHRVVFGGLDFTAPTRIDSSVLARLRALIPFAPLHQPVDIAPIDWLARRHPRLLQVACFDSAFHRAMPQVAQRYGLPSALHDAGARRYGFHGLSYEYVAARLREIDPAAAAGRAIVAHLGSGASLCALRAGASVATTMGFSALSGVMMATRPGELDPGIVIWLLRERGMTVNDVESLLYHDCGLKGVSGMGSDLRALLASDDARAVLATQLFVYRIVREIGSLAAALDGLDALVFTAGIGENAAAVRASVAAACGWLGVELDPGANDRPPRRAHGAALISTAASRVRVWIIPTDEEQVIARHALRVSQTAGATTRRAT